MESCLIGTHTPHLPISMLLFRLFFKINIHSLQTKAAVTKVHLKNVTYLENGTVKIHYHKINILNP